MDPFLTTYKSDYYQKSFKRLGNLGKTAEFNDPIGESFKNYLKLSSSTEPINPPTEDADDYLQHTYEQKQPKLAKIYYKEPINNTVMTKTFIYNGRSAYQIDYCNLVKDNEYKEEIRKKNMFRLPNDWDIPLTSQKYSHRNPTAINPKAMEPVKRTKTSNNLDPQHHIREILKVTTGKTEYMNRIGDLGELIMDDELHGKIILA